MRKYLSMMILALALIALPFIPAAMSSDTASIEHYAYTFSSATHEHVSTSTIIPGKHRILGFSVVPIVSGAGTNIAGIYDAATDAQLTGTNLLGEEGGVNTTTFSRVFPGPMDLANGLTIYAGAGTTVVVWYEKIIY